MSDLIAERLLSVRTKAFHDLLIEMKRGESADGNKRPDGIVKQEKRELVEAVTWLDQLASEFHALAREQDEGKRRAGLLRLSALSQRWLEQIDARTVT
jgi:hypothetical protein